LAQILVDRLPTTLFFQEGMKAGVSGAGEERVSGMPPVDIEGLVNCKKKKENLSTCLTVVNRNKNQVHCSV